MLKRAFKEREVDKIYHAVVQGHLDPLRGTVDAPIDRHPTHDYKWAVVSGGRDEHHPLRHARGVPRGEPGRGPPGDRPYPPDPGAHVRPAPPVRRRPHLRRRPDAGGPARPDPAVAARARRSASPIPAPGEPVRFDSPYPADLAHALERLRGGRNRLTGMGLMDALVRLDAVVLPRLARGARPDRPGLRRLAGAPAGRARPSLVLAVVRRRRWSAVGRRARAGRPADRRRSGSGSATATSIPEYLARGRAELGQLGARPRRTSPCYALVSFTAYLTPDQVAARSVGRPPARSTTVAAYWPGCRCRTGRPSWSGCRRNGCRTTWSPAWSTWPIARRPTRPATRPGAGEPAGAAPQRSRVQRRASPRPRPQAYRTACACVYALVVRGRAGRADHAGRAARRARRSTRRRRWSTPAQAVFVAPLPGADRPGDARRRRAPSSDVRAGAWPAGRGPAGTCRWSVVRYRRGGGKPPGSP